MKSSVDLISQQLHTHWIKSNNQCRHTIHPLMRSNLSTCSQHLHAFAIGNKEKCPPPPPNIVEYFDGIPTSEYTQYGLLPARSDTTNRYSVVDSRTHSVSAITRPKCSTSAIVRPKVPNQCHIDGNRNPPALSALY